MMLLHQAKLDGLDEDLVKAVEHCAKRMKVDIYVLSGKRTEEEQKILFSKKDSLVYGPNSPHVLGIAVDLVCVLGGKPQWDNIDLFNTVREKMEEVISLAPFIVWNRKHFQIIKHI